VGDSKVFTKDPEAILDYGIDWHANDWLGVDTIATGATGSTWTVPSGITKVSDSKTTTTTTIWLSGGTAGETYAVKNHIITAGGRAEDCTLSIVCESK
jgi:hypothetical protein